MENALLSGIYFLLDKESYIILFVLDVLLSAKEVCALVQWEKKWLLDSGGFRFNSPSVTYYLCNFFKSQVSLL